MGLRSILGVALLLAACKPAGPEPPPVDFSYALAPDKSSVHCKIVVNTDKSIEDVQIRVRFIAASGQETGSSTSFSAAGWPNTTHRGTVYEWDVPTRDIADFYMGPGFERFELTLDRVQFPGRMPPKISF